MKLNKNATKKNETQFVSLYSGEGCTGNSCVGNNTGSGCFGNNCHDIYIK